MPRTETEGQEKRKIVALANAVPRAIESKDKETILKIYDSHNPKFSTFEDTPDFLGLVNGFKFRKFIDGIGKLEASSINRNDVRVNFVSGKVAIVTGLDDWWTRLDGKVTKGVSRFTIIFWKKNGRWRIIHEHFTKIS